MDLVNHANQQVSQSNTSLPLVHISCGNVAGTVISHRAIGGGEEKYHHSGISIVVQYICVKPVRFIISCWKLHIQTYGVQAYLNQAKL